MDGGVIEFHALADADRAGPQHYDFLLIRNAGFVFLFVGGIKVGDIAFKFGSTGVNHFICRFDATLLSKAVNLRFRFVPQHADFFIGKAVFLGFPQCRDVILVAANLVFHCYDVPDFAEEEPVDGSLSCNAVHVTAQTEQLGDGIDPVVCADADVGKEFFPAHGIELAQMNMKGADLQGTDAFQQAFLKGPAYAHHFPGGFHLGGQGIVGVGKFVEGEAGQLGHHIIQRRFKRGGGVGNLDLVQGHANADLGGDTGDGVATGLGSQGGGTGYTGVDFD